MKKTTTILLSLLAITGCSEPTTHQMVEKDSEELTTEQIVDLLCAKDEELKDIIKDDFYHQIAFSFETFNYSFRFGEKNYIKEELPLQKTCPAKLSFLRIEVFNSYSTEFQKKGEHLTYQNIENTISAFKLSDIVTTTYAPKQQTKLFPNKPFSYVKINLRDGKVFTNIYKSELEARQFLKMINIEHVFYPN